MIANGVLCFDLTPVLPSNNWILLFFSPISVGDQTQAVVAVSLHLNSPHRTL